MKGTDIKWNVLKGYSEEDGTTYMENWPRDKLENIGRGREPQESKTESGNLGKPIW